LLEEQLPGITKVRASIDAGPRGRTAVQVDFVGVEWIDAQVPHCGPARESGVSLDPGITSVSAFVESVTGSCFIETDSCIHILWIDGVILEARDGIAGKHSIRKGGHSVDKAPTDTRIGGTSNPGLVGPY
jgi:hypothetical protein